MGRFFVSTPVAEGVATPPKPSSATQRAGAWAGVSGVPEGGRTILVDPYAGDVSSKNRKRVKKYGQYVPISYPEPTIHEETSPGDAEVNKLTWPS